MVFAGVSAAFVVENYRDSRNQINEMHQAVAGIIAELKETETKTRTFSDAILADIARWEDADRAGNRAVPGHFRIPGAPHPPSAAWNSAVASGVARMLEPKLRRDLGYFYSEFVGIHDNYDRYNQFTECEVLPKALLGVDAFYGPDDVYFLLFAFTWIYRKSLHKTCEGWALWHTIFAADSKPFKPPGSGRIN